MISRSFRVGLHSQRVTIAGFTLVRRTGSHEMAAFEAVAQQHSTCVSGQVLRRFCGYPGAAHRRLAEFDRVLSAVEALLNRVPQG